MYANLNAYQARTASRLMNERPGLRVGIESGNIYMLAGATRVITFGNNMEKLAIDIHGNTERIAKAA